MIEKICRNPKLGDRLKDCSGQIWVIAAPMALALAKIAILEGEEFVYV